MTDVSEGDAIVRTRDGLADCYFAHPAEGAHAGVILWPDALGLRPAFRVVGKRLASAGYSVIILNPYYRTTAAPIDVDIQAFSTPAGRDKVMRLASALTPDMTATDAVALAEYLRQQKSVDPTRKLGTIGYCLGGAMAIRTAMTLSDRVGAVAAFHGARLVTHDATSPHLRLCETRAAALIAIAENDDENAPATKVLLREAYDKANLPAEIEVYPDTKHGWCVPDAKSYDAAQADRAWERLLFLFANALA